MKQGRFIPLGFMLIATLACALPGSGASAPGPLDPNLLPTIVVLTVNAATTQTAAASPISTAASPGPPAAGGTTLEPLPDGGTKYTDHEVGFEVTYPAGWLTLRPDSDEFSSALAQEAVKNDMLRRQMEADLADFETGVDRLYSYPLRPDLEKNFAFGFSNIEWDPSDPHSVDQNAMGELVRSLETSGAIPGFRTDTAQVYENAGHVSLIELGGQFSLSDGQGGILPFYVTFVFFKPTSNSTVRMNFSYLKDYKPALATDVMSVITSIELLSQPNIND